MPQDHSVEIAEIESILNSGVESTTVDGTSTKISIESLRKRLNELRADDTTSISNNMVRPRAARIRLDFE